ncbi:MAG: glycosyltransferase, partial [Bacteroidetes bacterium]|nr:glycosyltransferase [Bacteroidota bacterium]
GYHLLKLPLIASSSLLHLSHVDPTLWKNKLGTSIGTTFIIGQLKKNFLTLAENCDALVPIAKWYKDILLLNGAPSQKIKLIKQGLPSAFKEQSKADFEKSNSVLRLIFIGRVHPLKGIHLLVGALMDLPDDKIQLDIYGKRNDDSFTRDCIKKTGHKKNIRWKNELANEQVVETMQQYDALCLCSTFSEMSPLVIQEAFAAGIPVIASDVYGNAEQIQHKKNGLLFKFKDEGSLKEQLLCCINNPQLLAEMKKNIEPPGSFAEVADEYYNLYQTLLS